MPFMVTVPYDHFMHLKALDCFSSETEGPYIPISISVHATETKQDPNIK